MAKQDNLVRPVTMKDYFVSTNYSTPSCIQLSHTNANHYEIKSSVIKILPSYYGLTHEEPYKHLDEFSEICSTVKIQKNSDDALKLILFPFSLKDKAKQWLKSLEGVRITTWEQL